MTISMRDLFSGKTTIEYQNVMHLHPKKGNLECVLKFKFQNT